MVFTSDPEQSFDLYLTRYSTSGSLALELPSLGLGTKCPWIPALRVPRWFKHWLFLVQSFSEAVVSVVCLLWPQLRHLHVFWLLTPVVL